MRSPVMTRFHREIEGSREKFILSSIESKTFDDFMEIQKFNILKILENSEDLELPNLLDYLDIDEKYRQIIMVDLLI